MVKSNFTRLQILIGNHLGLDANAVKPESDLIKDLGADSLSLIELIFLIEDEFELDVYDEVASKIVTVQDVLNYIERRYEF
jgi:acyl carrier protein